MDLCVGRIDVAPVSLGHASRTRLDHVREVVVHRDSHRSASNQAEDIPDGKRDDVVAVLTGCGAAPYQEGAVPHLCGVSGDQERVGSGWARPVDRSHAHGVTLESVVTC